MREALMSEPRPLAASEPEPYFVRLAAKKYFCDKCNRLLLTGRVIYVEVRCPRCGELNCLRGE
ncbi:Com family DNA-binding transcriptional regulator [Desulfarculus baarsii]